MQSKFLTYLLSLILAFNFMACEKAVEAQKVSTIKKETMVTKPVGKNYQSKADEALAFCKAKKMNEDFCILIDMEIHSGKKRFFVWDFKKKEVTNSFLVGHGCGDSSWSSDETKNSPTFSNVEDSHRTSLGKYRIGERGTSEWGVKIKYLMLGLEESNSNALKRFIVFHSWDEVSDDEIFPTGTPEGWGCPTISNASFKIIDPMLRSSSKPVLMWIFDDNENAAN